MEILNEAATIAGGFGGVGGVIAIFELLKEHGINSHQNMIPDLRFWEKNFWKINNIDQLKRKLTTPEAVKAPLNEPQLVSVKGTLYPCGLLFSGWWEEEKSQPHL